MEEEEVCDVGIGLRLGGGGSGHEQNPPVRLHLLFPLHPKEEISCEEQNVDQSSCMAVDEEEEQIEETYTNILISGSNNSTSSNNNKYRNTKKKLRLTKEQLALLENCFKRHSTVNMTQKLDLAVKLDLQPRQIEVWFQNRRARTKQKKVEMNYEVLKKRCESLGEENKKLKSELKELNMVMRFAQVQGRLTTVSVQGQAPGPFTGPWMVQGPFVPPLVSNQGHYPLLCARRFLPSAYSSGGEEPLLPRLTPRGTTPRGSQPPPGGPGELRRVSGQGRQVPASHGWAGAQVFGEGGVPLSLSSRLAVAPLFLGGSNGDGGTVAALAGDAGPCHPFRSFPHKIPTK
ncbi:hypothetical protein Sjap_022922 [Stephania japonica]|uniref:Homeobox domain-containing protein n=1 Tax=Stephania japonica TaxID=461633 RepID=A0AAP0HVD3_9MAGN